MYTKVIQQAGNTEYCINVGEIDFYRYTLVKAAKRIDLLSTFG
jgi:hypothetical protein